MKRLALLLGSLLVVSAAASAKEVVPAPVVVQETPVQIVEKEVIVYREKEPEWRPSGFFKVQETYYGETENNKYAGKQGWNDNNVYGRLQLEGGIQMTEKQSMDFRVRNYQSWNSLGEKKDDQVRVRYYFDHGNVGDSKVNATSRVRYQKTGSSHLAEYRLDFDFAEYLFNNDFVKTSTAVIGPRYIYAWTGHNKYSNNIGLYADLINEFPLGFSTEIEIDGAQYSKYNKAEYNYGHKDDFNVTVNAKLMHNWNLYTADKYSFDWAFEGGYDSYNYSNEEVFAKQDGGLDDASYSLYAKPAFVLTYNATKFVSVYGEVGAEYRNWQIEANTEAKNWRWQPFATVLSLIHI